jgi:hypothetical protein
MQQITALQGSSARPTLAAQIRSSSLSVCSPVSAVSTLP